MEFGLKGKVSIVTGAGAGIGKSIALTLAREGAVIVVNDINGEAAENVSKEITAGGSKSLAIKADIANASQINQMVSKVLDHFGKVDILVNNAGVIYGPEGPKSRPLFWELEPEQLQEEVELILYGTMNCCRAVLSNMIARKCGRIVNIASDAGRMGGSKKTNVYSAAKGGVIAFTRALATEVGEYNVTVNTVSPGMVRTERSAMLEAMEKTNPEMYRFYKAFLDQFLPNIPLGRLGNPKDIANMVTFLASDAASWVTGQTISVNGGHLMI